MNKKLLLTTVLSSALMFSGTVAKADEVPFSYDGNNQFTFQNVQYNSAQTLVAAVSASGADPSVDNIVMTQATQRQYFLDLIAENSTTFDQFAAIVSNENVTAQQIKEGSVEGLAAMRSLVELGYLDDGTSIPFDVNDLLESDLPELNDFLMYAIEVNNVAKAEILIDKTFTTREQELASANAELEALIDQKNALLAIANKTAEQKAEILALNAQIHSDKGFNEVRNSKENQENLKSLISLIANAASSASNENLNQKSVLHKESLTKSLNDYLITDFTGRSVDEAPEVQKSDVAITDGLINASLATRSVVDSRITNFAGVASGDAFESYGVWAQGAFTQGSQKAHGNAPGYKFSQKGVTIGVDTGDESMIGGAYSFFQNDIKNKTNSSNKEDVTSHTGTLYGKYAITNEVFVSGQAQFGYANIKKKRATGDLANNIAKGKTKATTIAGKAEVGYDYAVDSQIHIIPTAGFAYTSVKVNSYKETGEGLNREVGKRTATRTSGIASVTAKYIADMGSMKVIPEVHAAIDYAFSSKNSDTKVKLVDGIDAIATPSEKLTKGYYNVGTSVKAVQSDMYEISAGYDLGIAKKFQSHTGTLKLRVNL
ncbi:autotransporter outer membrane beta-barrel domain-containing protein [Rickettsiaceae bacterium]|nr:autotransporter outer membrane beta-barrel domain-containing protein [Rickettsiaceae bacterium]